MIISPIGILLLVLSHDLFTIYLNPKNGNASIRLSTSPYIFLMILGITIFIGFVYGAIYIQLNDTKLPTKEMKNRSSPKGLWESVLIAICCAFALPYGFKNSDTSLLMAVGIATSLLPPLVNIGLNYGAYYGDENKYEDKKYVGDALKYSSIIFLINFITLFIGLYIYMNYGCLKN